MWDIYRYKTTTRLRDSDLVGVTGGWRGKRMDATCTWPRFRGLPSAAPNLEGSGLSIMIVTWALRRHGRRLPSWLRPPRHQRFLMKIFASPCNFDGAQAPGHSQPTQNDSFDRPTSRSLLVRWGGHLHLSTGHAHASLFWARGTGPCSTVKQPHFTHGCPSFVVPLDGFESATRMAH